MAGIKTASLELSKRLQELAPGWDDTEYFSIIPITDDGKRHKRVVIPTNELCSLHEHKPVIAPDLDWLLNRLPPHIRDSHGTNFALMGYPNGIQPWFAYKSGLEGEDARWPNDKGIPFYKRAISGESACDAACALLINLLEQKVIEV